MAYLNTASHSLSPSPIGFGPKFPFSEVVMLSYLWGKKTWAIIFVSCLHYDDKPSASKH